MKDQVAKDPHHSEKQQLPHPPHNKTEKTYATKNTHPQFRQKTKKWATFTYHSHKVRKITNLYKQTDIKIAFRSTNMVQQHTRTRLRETTTDHNKSGIYKLQCKTCNKAYIGQTNRILSIRYSKHIKYIKNNDPQSAYAQHILRNIHEYGTLTDTM
jgi:hypothetical protein